MTSGACGTLSLGLCTPHSLSLSVSRCIVEVEQVVSGSLQRQGPPSPPGEGFSSGGAQSPGRSGSDPRPWMILELKGPEHLIWSEQSPQCPTPPSSANPFGEFEGLSGEVGVWGHMGRTVREEQGESDLQ